MAKPTLDKIKKELQDMDKVQVTRDKIQKELKKGTDIEQWLKDKGMDEKDIQKILSDLGSYDIT